MGTVGVVPKWDREKLTLFGFGQLEVDRRDIIESLCKLISSYLELAEHAPNLLSECSTIKLTSKLSF